MLEAIRDARGGRRGAAEIATPFRRTRHLRARAPARTRYELARDIYTPVRGVGAYHPPTLIFRLSDFYVLSIFGVQGSPRCRGEGWGT